MENRPGKFPKYGNNGVKEKLGKNTQSFKKQTHEVGNYPKITFTTAMIRPVRPAA